MTSLYRPEKSRVAFLEHHEIEIEMLKETLHEIETETPATRNDESAPLLVGLCIGRRSQEGKSAGTVQQNRMSSWSSLLVAAVWCIVVAACMGQEQCRSGTFTTADYLRGDCKLDLGELSTAELRQICARTGFEEAMTVIRRRQRDDPAPNREDLIVEAEKCLVLDVMRSSDPKKWARDIMSLSYEQYTLLRLGRSDTHRNIFGGVFQAWSVNKIARTYSLFSMTQELDVIDLYKLAVEIFSLSDEEMRDEAQEFMSAIIMRDMEDHVVAYVNMLIYRIAVSIDKLDEIDEKIFLLMLSHVDPNALERLITGDIPDLKSMQPRTIGNWTAVAFLGAIALGSAYLVKRSGIFAGNGREKDGKGQRVRVGGKKKGRRRRGGPKLIPRM